MKLFRTFSTPRLLALLAAVVAIAAAASIGSIAAFGSSAPTPPPKPLDQAIKDALNAPEPAGVTARVKFTNNLFPSGALSGMSGAGGSALTSGGSGRLWWSPADKRGRIELQSDAGDAQILWDSTHVTVWDSSSNTVYDLPIPAHQGTDSGSGQDQGPTLAGIDTFLANLTKQADDLGREPGLDRGRAGVQGHDLARPFGRADRLRRARLGRRPGRAARDRDSRAGAVDPGAGADGHRHLLRPGLCLRPGRQPARRREEGRARRAGRPGGSAGEPQKVSGLDAVQAAVPFTVVAPDTLVGLPRQSVQLLGGQDKGALVLYGHGLGGIALVEHAAGSRLRPVVEPAEGRARARDRTGAGDRARHGSAVREGRRQLRPRRLDAAGGGRSGGAEHRRVSSVAEPVVARGLTKRYGDLVAVDDVDLTVEAGDVFGYLGPNGAGKTTSLRMLLGLIRPTAGAIELFGRDPLAPGGARA